MTSGLSVRFTAVDMAIKIDNLTLTMMVRNDQVWLSKHTAKTLLFHAVLLLLLLLFLSFRLSLSPNFCFLGRHEIRLFQGQISSSSHIPIDTKGLEMDTMVSQQGII